MPLPIVALNRSVVLKFSATGEGPVLPAGVIHYNRKFQNYIFMSYLLSTLRAAGSRRLPYILSLSVVVVSMTAKPSRAQLYKDPDVSVDRRVDDLLSRMTLEEKVGQMTQLNISMINTTGVQRDVVLDPQKARNLLQNHHIGSFLNGEAVAPQQWITYIRQLQRIAIEETRLGIPLIYGIDHMHGASYVEGSTIFPHNINIAATFNPENSTHNGLITALESAPLGHSWNFAPVLDLGRNPYWARMYETFGEDPYLASVLGAAYVRAYQQNHDEVAPYRLAATGKHFIGYSVPRSGWDRTPVDLSMQTIHEFHRPAFQAAVDAGLKTIMVNSGEINGIPVHASEELLSGLLRQQMGFEGVIVTDWADIEKLVDYHKTAADYDEATRQAIEAGIDMSMTPESLAFNESLLKLVRSGIIPEERIDESVKRILKLKFELGLFEHPYPTGKGLEKIGSPDHKARALQAARESMVLLQNNGGTLPFSARLQNILVVGPSANDKSNLAGGWTLAWQGAEEERYPASMNTITEAIREEFPNARVTAIDSMGAPGSSQRSLFDAAVKRAQAIVIAAGETPYTEFVGNITSLALPDEQLDLIRTVNSYDKPTVLVLIEGRPRIITDIVSETPAILWAGLPGFEGADAIADILIGEYNPSGKLPFSYPQFVGHQIPYNHKPSATYFFDAGQANNIEQADKTTALWNFGHGLSYTSFSYSGLTLSDTTMSASDQITAKVTVMNTGDRPGTETLLWFITDEVGRITRPVKELVHFERIEMDAGESREVSFTIHPSEHLTYPDFNGQSVLENGRFTLHVGKMSKSFHLATELQSSGR